jgi:PIN domain nuclease of toxin-antitoxin system
VRILLDTHFLLWWLADDPALGERARQVIASPDHLVCYSAASVWEIRIKQRIGKLELPDDFADSLAAQAFVPLAITTAHAHAIKDLPLHHRDPFDRMLVAQAQIERLTLLTRDEQLAKYEVATLLA